MISVIGQLLGTSGYASHTRGLVNELNKLTKCKIISAIPQGFETQVNDAELEMIKREQDYDINLIITHPLHWRANLSAKRNFVYLIWEGDKVPKWIAEECLNPKIEKIICPSEHTKQALLNTIQLKEEHIVVIPHGVDLETFYPITVAKSKREGDSVSGKRPSDGTHADNSCENSRPLGAFKFLANKGLRNLEDRGGLQYLIKAYLDEFTESDNTELILKINPAYGVPNLLNMFPELKKKGIPKVTYIHDNYTVSQLNDLYNSCDVFVSPTRAEAFNIPCLEALACGKPVITTTFGGQTDFIKENHNGWLIDGKLTEVKHETEYEGVSWLTPNMEDLKKILRMCYTNQEIVKEVSKNCVKSIEHLTWANTAKQIHSLI